MDVFLDISGISRHEKTPEEFSKSPLFKALDNDWNERNYGAGVTAKDGNTLYTLGGYKNSIGNNSYYAGMGYERQFNLTEDVYLGLGMLGGVVTGYEDPITPMVLPKLSLGLKDLGSVNLMYAPEYKDKTPAVWMMNLSVPFE